MDYYKYQFSLKGEHESLTRSMATFDRSQDVVFLEDSSDVPDYYFSSVHLEGLTKESEVWDRATQLLKLYNAAHELAETAGAYPRLHYPSLGLEKLYIGDSNVGNYAPNPMPSKLVGPFDASIPPNKAENGTLYGQLLYLARTEPDAYEVLLLFSQVHYMPDFYKVFESVKTALGDNEFDSRLVAAGLKAAYQSFKSTTNNYDVGKENARHGRNSPKGTKPRAGSTMPVAMTPEEAKTLAMKIGRLFFTAKYNFIFPAEADPSTPLIPPSGPLIDDDF